MEVFKDYARYYSLFYRDKDYDAEAAYVVELISAYAVGGPVRRIIDVGCGTGSYDLALRRKGYVVDGVDQSERMIELARRYGGSGDGLQFHTGSAESFALGIKADAVVSLFHVFSYLTSNELLSAALVNIRRHLVPGGLLIFDFWFGPAVLNLKPGHRCKKVQDGQYTLYRYATPTIDVLTNIVDVHYDILAVDSVRGTTEATSETHRMRYFFVPELKMFLEQAGYRIEAVLEWMKCDRAPHPESWSACIVARA